MKKKTISFLLAVFMIVVMAQVAGAISETDVQEHADDACCESSINFELWGEKNINLCVQKLRELSKDDEVLRGESCPYCGVGNFVLVNTQYGGEEYAGYEPCKHKPSGVDYIYKRPVYKYYKCNRCGAGTNTISYTYRTECHGVYGK